LNSKFSEKCKECSVFPLCFNLVCPATFVNVEEKDVKKCPIEKDALNDILVMIACTRDVEKSQSN
jgi:sulfatase maturation enzyme AslB (radical SAM superfamily)